MIGLLAFVIFAFVLWTLWQRLADLQRRVEAQQVAIDSLARGASGLKPGAGAGVMPVQAGLAPRIAPPPDAATSLPTIAAKATPPVQPSIAAKPIPPRTSFEERLGTRWAVWLGGIALAFGGILMVLYSIEQGFFGPGVRTAIAAVFSAALVGAGEWFRRNGQRFDLGGVPAAHIPSILTAAGTTSGFGTIYAAHALYGFIGPAAAFVLLGIAGVATMSAAALHGPALAGLGLAGALVTPLLISSPNPSPWPVVLYLAVVAAAAFWLARARKWLWLAAAVVAGAVLWGLALTGSAAAPSAGDRWTMAVHIHTLVQLVLAAVFMVFEPHRGVRDEKAGIDWIASAALAALTALVVLVLATTRFDASGWLLFAIAAMAILGVTGIRIAPAAAATALAGVVAIAVAACWPGLRAPPEARLLWPAVADVMRVPEIVQSYLTFVTLAVLAVTGAATWRLWAGRSLLPGAANVYALAAILTPLTALVVAYLRVTQFDRSYAFAGVAVTLAGLLYLVADRFDNVAAEQKSPLTRFCVGVYAAGCTAAAALAFAFALERGYLTAALAVTAATTSIFAVIDKIPTLRYMVAAIGLVVLARLAWDPRIMGADVGTWPIVNWLLVGYGVPAAAFLGAGYVLKREKEDLASRLCDALGVVFAFLLVFFEIRHWLNNGDPLAATSGHVEQGLVATLSLGVAFATIKADLARGNIVFRFASIAFGVLAVVQSAFTLGLVENPIFTRDPIGGGAVFSTLLLGYLLPGLAAILLARTARNVRPKWFVTMIAVLALALLFGYVTLETRHVFQGERIGLFQSTSAVEVWAYSAVWLALGIAFLAYGIVRGSLEARLASAGLVVLSTLKVFLLDFSGITGFWRAFSFMCLGLVLIGIGVVYQRWVFVKPKSAVGG